MDGKKKNIKKQFAKYYETNNIDLFRNWRSIPVYCEFSTVLRYHTLFVTDIY